MILTPSKKLITSRYKQRGNIVFTTGLAPSRLVDTVGNYVDTGLPSGTGGWTLDGEWQNLGDGDLQNIWDVFNSFGGRPRASTLYWSPDGTRLTLTSSTSDDTIVFNVATPFDPNTTSYAFSYPFSNPSWGQYNSNGTRYVEHGTTDTMRMRAANNWGVNSDTVLSDVSKSEVGFTGSVDGFALFGPLLDYILWLGEDGGGDAIKNISIPNFDLDAFVVEETHNDGAINPNSLLLSNLDKAETACIAGKGAQGVSFITMDSPREITSWSEGATQSINSLVTFDFRPSILWFDPNDTRYVWGIADPTNNLQMVRFATNVPESL